MEPAVDTVVLVAVRRGRHHPRQLVGASSVPGRELFAALRRLERDGLLARRRSLFRLTSAGEEALRIRRLELG